MANYGLVAGLIVLACVLFNTDRTQSAVWYGPYLSAAANVEWGDFRYDLQETIAFKDLEPAEREAYRFQRSEDLIPYRNNAVGYVYVVAAAKALFGWLPDLRAVEALQITLHTLFCTWIIFRLRSPAAKVLFLVLYALNPVVIYYVTFPFYYFAQAIPSFALLLLMIRDEESQTRPLVTTLLLVSAAVLLGVVFLARPSTIGAIAAFFLLAVARPRLRWPAVGAVLLFLMVVVTGRVASPHGPWHTAYIGIGAYPNEYVPAFNDNVGYALYRDKTGAELNASLGGNLYDDDVLTEYVALARQEYLSILERDWPRFVRNVVLNTLQGFSIGYMAGQPYWLHGLVALSGLVVIVLLLWSGQYVLFGLIGLTIGTFVPFSPPIPAYMYGAYALLVFGSLGVLEKLRLLDPVNEALARLMRRWRPGYA